MARYKGMDIGFLFFYEWLPLTDRLSDKQFRIFFRSLLNYQRENTPIPDGIKSETLAMIQTILPTIQRRKEGYEGTKKQYNALSFQNQPSPPYDEYRAVGPYAPSIAQHSIAQHSIAQHSIAQHSIAQHSIAQQSKEEQSIAQQSTQHSTALYPNSSPPSSIKEGETSACEGNKEADIKEDEGERLFQIFWEAYPKKIDQTGARKAFASLSPDQALVDRMLSVIYEQKRSNQWQEEDGRYIPYPANWLSQRRFEDAVKVEVDNATWGGDFSSFNTDEFFQAALERSYAQVRETK